MWIVLIFLAFMLTKLLAILIHCELRKEDYKTWIQVLEDQPYLALSKKKKKKERERAY